MTTFVAICFKTISGTSNYVQKPQDYWSEVVVLRESFGKRKVEVHIFERFFLRGISPPKKTETTKTSISKIWSVLYKEIFISEKSVV